MRHRILAIFVIVASTANVLAQPAPPARAPSQSGEQASMLGYGDRDKTCAAWTDGCGTCRRDAKGDPLCPNIGIACTPTPIKCVFKIGEPDPDAPKPPAPAPAPTQQKSDPPNTEAPKTEAPKQ
jgi:hypothetical protein